MTHSALVFEIKNHVAISQFVMSKRSVNDKNHSETRPTRELSSFVKALHSNMFAYLGHQTKANLKGMRISRVSSR